MVRQGRVTIGKSGALYVVKVAGKVVAYGRSKSIANAKAKAIRKSQGK